MTNIVQDNSDDDLFAVVLSEKITQKANLIMQKNNRGNSRKKIRVTVRIEEGKVEMFFDIDSPDGESKSSALAKKIADEILHDYPNILNECEEAIKR